MVKHKISQKRASPKRSYRHRRTPVSQSGRNRWEVLTAVKDLVKRAVRAVRPKRETVQRSCHINADCDKGMICVNGWCVPSSSESNVANDEDNEYDNEDVTGYARYPKVWELKPGDKGFNDYVEGLLGKAAFDPHLSCEKSTGKGKKVDRLYQRVLAWLVHPKTPIRRLLVAWQLGMGKTIGMLRVLDNFFDEEWPKIILFPGRSCPSLTTGNRSVQTPSWSIIFIASSPPHRIGT
jgi:hypothetical protein